MTILHSIRKSAYLLAFLVVSLSLLGFRAAGVDSPDLSTPQKSFKAFVNVLKSGKVEMLPKVATETGQISLVALYAREDYKLGMAELGKELEACELKWDEITEDIYFVSARITDKIHKMEFTKEEPGWMLYHWQIGGGADLDSHEASPAED